MFDYILGVLSLGLFTAGIFLVGKNRAGPARTLLLYLFASLFFISCILFAVSFYFTGKSYDESVLYHLAYGVSGAGFREYLGIILGALLFLVLGLVLLNRVLAHRPSEQRDPQGKWGFVAALASMLLATLVMPSNVQFIGTLFAEQKNDFYHYYRTPRIKDRPEQKRNLLVIYAEGLEGTFFNQELFPNLTPGLRALAAQNTSFTNVRQVWGSSWTIAGMTASQCGIPLVTPSHGNSMNGMDQFLGGAECLGNLLEKEGYRFSYMGGAALKFAGKGKFYASHGFTEIQGRNALRRKLADPRYMGPWGLYDDALLDLAYDKYIDLSASAQPFGLFMLTLDTHPPRGHPSKSCRSVRYGDGTNPYLNAVACSDFLISNFVNKVIASDYAKNTVIVIASDHLAMNNTAYDQLKAADRTNMLIIIDPTHNAPREVKAQATALDTGTAVLHILGYAADLGLGRNLLAGEPSLSESLTEFNRRLPGWKNSLVEFWDFPRVRERVLIDPIMRSLAIDDRTFQLPALITLNDKLETTIRFQFDSSPEHKKLIDHVRDFDKDMPFIWIDSCKHVKSVNGNRGLCVVAGKLGAERLINTKVEKEYVLSKDLVRGIVKAAARDNNYLINKAEIGL